MRKGRSHLLFWTVLDSGMKEGERSSASKQAELRYAME